MITDLLGQFIKSTPNFKGKWRIRQFWLRGRPQDDVRVTRFGSGLAMRLHLHVPYEAMVWLEQEEPDDLLRLGELLRPGDFFVDIGANIGLWTLAASKAVGASGKVLAFEPNPETFRKLSENIALNRFEPRVSAWQTAVSAARGEVRFCCSPEHNNSRIVTADEPNTVMVASAPVTDFVGDRLVSGIKIDVEGHELAALDTARPVLERSFPWLVVEFNTLAAGVSNLGDWPVFSFLKSLGYEAYLMGDRQFESPLATDRSFQGYLNLLFRKTTNGFPGANPAR